MVPLLQQQHQADGKTGSRDPEADAVAFRVLSASFSGRLRDQLQRYISKDLATLMDVSWGGGKDDRSDSDLTFMELQRFMEAYEARWLRCPGGLAVVLPGRLLDLIIIVLRGSVCIVVLTARPCWCLHCSSSTGARRVTVFCREPGILLHQQQQRRRPAGRPPAYAAKRKNLPDGTRDMLQWISEWLQTPAGKAAMRPVVAAQVLEATRRRGSFLRGRCLRHRAAALALAVAPPGAGRRAGRLLLRLLMVAAPPGGFVLLILLSLPGYLLLLMRAARGGRRRRSEGAPP